MSDPQQLSSILLQGSADDKLAAAEQLARLESDARPAAVALVESLKTDDDALRDWLVAALESLGPPADDAIEPLAKLTASESLDVAYWAATLLGRAEAQAASAVDCLSQALAEHPDLVVRQRAAWALGKIGPAATGARDALESASKSEDARLARLAGEALAQIGG